MPTPKPNVPDVATAKKKTIDHISLFGKANEIDVRKMQFRCSKKSSMTGKMDKMKYIFFRSGIILLLQWCTLHSLRKRRFMLDEKTYQWVAKHFKICQIFRIWKSMCVYFIFLHDVEKRELNLLFSHTYVLKITFYTEIMT